MDLWLFPLVKRFVPLAAEPQEPLAPFGTGTPAAAARQPAGKYAATKARVYLFTDTDVCWPLQTGTEIRQAVFPVRQEGCCLQIEDLGLFPEQSYKTSRPTTCPASSYTLNSWARFPVSYRDCSAAQGEVIFPILGHEIIDLRVCRNLQFFRWFGHAG